MASVPGRFLNQENIMRKVFDETTDSLRVNASVSAVNVNLSAAGGDNVAISDGVDTLLVNPDGSINVNPGNLEISHTDDSIRLGDGTNYISSSQRLSGENGLDVNSINKVFSKPFNDIEVTNKNDDSNPITIVSRLNGVLVQTATVTYDSDGDFQRVQVV